MYIYTLVPIPQCIPFRIDKEKSPDEGDSAYAKRAMGGSKRIEKSLKILCSCSVLYVGSQGKQKKKRIKHLRESIKQRLNILLLLYSNAIRYHHLEQKLVERSLFFLIFMNLNGGIITGRRGEKDVIRIHILTLYMMLNC